MNKKLSEIVIDPLQHPLVSILLEQVKELAKSNIETVAAVLEKNNIPYPAEEAADCTLNPVQYQNMLAIAEDGYLCISDCYDLHANNAIAEFLENILNHSVMDDLMPFLRYDIE